MPIENPIATQLEPFGFPIVQAAPNAITATNPTAPAALTQLVANFTWTANDPGLNTGLAVIADGLTVGDDNDAGDALSVLQNELNAHRTDAIASRAEAITYEIAISALVVDITALRTIAETLITEMTRIKLMVAS